MKPEEFEVYVIPPNFMEGGTLFGGLLKTRNTIEAVILGLAVGVPVLHLPFSLTVRVVILCLTALPLVLLALIGVSGMSLSAFIRLFFCFLHNRRILSRDGTQGGKNGKTLLPSWAQQRKSDCEAEDPPLPKSRSRFSVDLKQRSMTQFKTFLQEEEAVQPLNALADYIPIEKIEHGVIYTRDHRYVKVVEVVPVNFLLRSAREQRSIIYSFISYLKIAPVKVQFKALTKRADINRHLDTVRRELEHEQDPRCRVLQEDYLKLIRQLGSREAITRRFFLVFEYEPLPGTKRGHEEEDAIASLQTAARTAANYLRQCGNEVISPENEDDATAEILYNILCRRASSEPFYQRVKSVLADYMASGRDISTIPVNEFYAPDSIDLISALQRTKCPTYKNRYSKTEYMTPANIERINKLLRCAFGQAVRWDIIAKNPFENTTLPKIKRKPREIWDAATIRKALDECKDGRLYVAINLSFACSLRIGEIVGLTWDNIHISDADIASDNAYLCVEKELVRVREDSLAVLGEEEIIKKFPRTMYLEDASTVIVLKTPKTESSVRKVWMPKTVAYILREWKASQDKQKEFLGSEYLDYNLVVALPNGRPCEETVISNAFRRLKRDAQLPDVVFHSLRHSSTTYKLKLNHGDIKATQGDTGHSQADMVTKVYAHILDEDRKVNAQKFESAFYANPDLRGVQAPAEQAPALDVQSIILQLQQSPELLSALTSLISNQGCK